MGYSLYRISARLCSGKDPAAILGGLTAVMRDKNSDDQEMYKAKLLEELLVCVTDGLFSLQDICKAIHILSIFYPENKRCRDVVDKLWFGLIDQSKDMTTEEIVSVFTTLPHLTKSRNMILRVLQQLKYDSLSQGFLRMLSGWLVVNIHKVTEQDMLAITYSFLKLEYTDTALITALEKIIKKKGCKIMEYDLICTICSYCLAMRIRSPIILEGVGQYFIEHHQSLTISQVSIMSGIFGQLDFHPANGFKFWEIAETILDTKFNQFPPVDIINLLVSFLYLGKFPPVDII